jgi:CRP-like cAMP-binding protein
MDLSAIVGMLGRTELFGALTEADRATIAGRMRRAAFAPDQMIFSRGDPGRDIYLVVEGRIRLSILSSDGRELSFAHAGPHFVGAEAAIGCRQGAETPPRSRHVAG